MSPGASKLTLILRQKLKFVGHAILNIPDMKDKGKIAGGGKS